MAPLLTQESSTVGNQIEARIAAEAAEKLASSLPDKSVPEIVEDLLARLNEKREQRERKGLNHWESFCPSYLERLVTKFKVGDPLRQVVRFIVVNHSSAVEFAARITCDADMAETAVSRTYIELLKGGTTITLFYHALKMNARNLLRGRKRELKRYESLDGLVSTARADHALAADSDSSDSSEDIDFPSPRLEDQNPLEVLIARDEQRQTDDELTYAIRNVRRSDNWWILQTKWWQSSGLAELERALRTSDFGGSGE